MKTIINRKYLLPAILLLLTEIFIAYYVYNKLIRNYIGDVLVVMLIYSFIKSFWDMPIFKAALYVLLFAYSIEFLQYLQLLKFLELEDSKIAAVILGRNFTWIDMGAYTVGICLIIITEKILLKRNNLLIVKQNKKEKIQIS
ncbi:MAG: DUF2809 domain-containing protein [Fimbriimonadaceae bacterium]|nr:DUF2809 domain-containing protein [Chitinophagales bacterium]